MILIAGAAADADGAHNLAVPLERDAAGKNHDLPVVGGVDAEKLSTRLRVRGQILSLDIESP